MLPEDWTVGNDVVGRTSLFNSNFANLGQNVTVKVLENELFSNASFNINTMLGYEVINATDTHAYAVLPFNIQPSS
jgi:predicted transglutaminase-like protease